MIQPRIGIGVLIFNSKNQVLLGKRINSLGEGTWAPPGGHLEFGETLEECAIREVLEETGLTLTPPIFVGLTNTIFTAEQKQYVSIFMRINCPENQIPQITEPHKCDALDWFSCDALPQPLFPPFAHLLAQQKID